MDLGWDLSFLLIHPNETLFGLRDPAVIIRMAAQLVSGAMFTTMAIVYIFWRRQFLEWRVHSHNVVLLAYTTIAATSFLALTIPFVGDNLLDTGMRVLMVVVATLTTSSLITSVSMNRLPKRKDDDDE